MGHGSGTGLSASAVKSLVGRWAPLCLMVVGLFLFSFRSETAFMVGVAAAVALTVATTYLLIFQNRELRLMWLVSAGILLGYTVGTLNTTIGLASSGNSIAQYFSTPQDSFSVAMAAIVWVGAMLFFLGIFEPPIKIAFNKFRKSDFLYVALFLCIEAAAFATGQIGYMGISSDDAHHVGVIGELAGLFIPVLPALTILIRKQVKYLDRNLIFWAAIAIELIALVPLGRRVILYSMLLTFLSSTLRGSTWKLPLVKKLLLILLTAVVFYCANIFFFAMRHAKNETKNKKMGLYETASRALDFLSSGKNEEFKADVNQNLRDRTFVIRYFADLLDASWTHRPLLGRDALFCVQMAMPSSLYPDKQVIMNIGMEENLVNPEFGLYATDEANSILTTGVSDFGLLGALLYPILLATVLHIFCKVITSKSPAILQAVVTLCVVFPLIQTEVSGTGSLVRIRDLTILTFILLPIEAILSRSRERRRPASLAYAN